MYTRWLLAIICRTLIIMRKFRICKLSCKVYWRMHSIMINSARHELLEIAYILATNNLACTMCHQDDDIKWNHFPRYWPFVRGIHRSPVTFVRGIHRSPVNSPHKGQWRGALMFPLICAWTNAWVNNREAGDLRRHRAHYDVIIMIFCLFALYLYDKFVDDIGWKLRTQKTQQIEIRDYIFAIYHIYNISKKYWDYYVITIWHPT